MNILDELSTIEGIDKSNMRQLLYDLPHQGERETELMRDVRLPGEYKEVRNITITGLGGSSVGGDILKNLLRDRLRIPLIVNRSYTLPRLVNKESLLICVSYSGNTEETLSAYTIGKKRGSRVVVISSGGELTSLAKEDGFPHIMVPSGMPPRTALGYLFFSQLFLLKTLGFVSVEDKELEETVQTLTSLRREIDVQTPKDENMAKKLAEKIYDTVVLIYTTSDFLEGVGVRWKTQINENSKNPAYYEFFPELDHNEIMGWEGVPEGVSERFSLILLRDRGESERMVKRINITSELIKERISRILEVTSRGEGLLSRIFSLIYIGDYVSFYLAILKGVDPTEIRSIDRLKRRMKE